MKKTFQLNSENKTPERQIDSIKYEVKKYIARERRKKLPENFDYWDFDCKIGLDQTAAKTIHLSKINEKISEISITNTETFYLEILSKAAKRMKSNEDKR